MVMNDSIFSREIWLMSNDESEERKHCLLAGGLCREFKRRLSI